MTFSLDTEFPSDSHFLSVLWRCYSIVTFTDCYWWEDTLPVQLLIFSKLLFSQVAFKFFFFSLIFWNSCDVPRCLLFTCCYLACTKPKFLGSLKIENEMEYGKHHVYWCQHLSSTLEGTTILTSIIKPSSIIGSLTISPGLQRTFNEWTMEYLVMLILLPLAHPVYLR